MNSKSSAADSDLHTAREMCACLCVFYGFISLTHCNAICWRQRYFGYLDIALSPFNGASFQIDMHLYSGMSFPQTLKMGHIFMFD
jgi:hypothetical protein